MSSNTLLVGIYDDDDHLLDAVKTLRNRDVKIKEVYTPFPVHGLEHALGYAESRLPTVAFICGALGTTTALSMQVGMYYYDWQVNIGGKPLIPLPAFIPVTFELTVLFASLGMVFAYLIVNKMFPGAKTEIIDPRQTDDLFIITVEPTENETENEAVKTLYRETGAVEVREQAPLKV